MLQIGYYWHCGAFSAQAQATDIPKVPPRRKSKKIVGTRKPTAKANPRSSQSVPIPLPIVGVGASAGGLEAFTQLLQNLPVDTGMAFVLVQHLDPDHASALTQILAKATPLPVQEAKSGQRVLVNHVYVIPPNASMRIAGGVLRLQPRKKNEHRAIDTFFRSLAEDQQECAIGVILSGTASDGTLGLEAIKAEGGFTFAQDESAKFRAMPRNAVAAGCVDLVLTPQGIAKELVRMAQHPYLARTSATPGAKKDQRKSSSARASDTATPTGLKSILISLRKHSGVDFTFYKDNTVRRRIDRRMALNKITSLDDYARVLRDQPKEVTALHQDLLIGVTNFFRNPEAFEVLKQRVFPASAPERGQPVRIWVPGCSTGQEAYSIAMAFAEFCDGVARAPTVQIFATDVNEEVLGRARAGLFLKPLVQDVSPERLRRFFVEEDGAYRVAKSLRESVIFAQQNLLTDPPFSRMHLISCRNLMIYLEPTLQNSILPKFHYALRPKGFLFIGASESVGPFTNLFESMDKKHKIFSKKPGPSPALKVDSGPRHSEEREKSPAPAGVAAMERSRPELNAEQEADRITLTRHAPPSVLVNAELQVLQFRGDTSAYLKPPRGRATFDVLKMAAADLMLPLRAILNRAKKEKQAVRSKNVQFTKNGQTFDITIEVVPLKNSKERCSLIFFEEPAVGRRDISDPSPEASVAPRRKSKSAQGSEADRRRIAVLERELADTREYLQSLQEQSEAANEELQASNEEVTSANEELQSINEELETSQEELESTNEELTTLNEEMTNRNAELGILNSDLTNLQSSAQVPIVLLGRDLSIRRFTVQAEKQFNLLAADMGRPITQIRHNLDLPDLEQFVGEVITTVRANEREVCDVRGRWYSLRVRPYLSLDNKVEGAVLVLIDIDALKQTEKALRATEERFRTLFELGPVAVYSCNATGVIQQFNRRAAELWGREPKPGDTDELFCGSFKMIRIDGKVMAHAECPMADVLSGKIPEARDAEVIIEQPGGGRVPVIVNIRPLKDDQGAITGAINCFYDITARKEADHHRELLMGELDHRLKNTLATVQSIARYTGRNAESVEGFRKVFDARLWALSQTHNLLRAGGWNSTALREIIIAELLPYDSTGAERCAVKGENIYLNSRQALALGMAVHELTTNAVKYGALSVASGRIEISWDTHLKNGASEVHLRWIESGGPAVAKPRKRGFGSQLIQQGLASDLDANVHLDFHPDGLRFALKFPLDSTTA